MSDDGSFIREYVAVMYFYMLALSQSSIFYLHEGDLTILQILPLRDLSYFSYFTLKYSICEMKFENKIFTMDLQILFDDIHIKVVGLSFSKVFEELAFFEIFWSQGMDSHNGSVGKMLKESYFLFFGGEMTSKRGGGETQPSWIYDVFSRIISLICLNIKYVMQKSQKRIPIYSKPPEVLSMYSRKALGEDYVDQKSNQNYSFLSFLIDWLVALIDQFLQFLRII